MKWDKLENYIQTNRDELDNLNPSESLWQKIEVKLDTGPTNKRIIYWQVAAVLFFVLSLGLLFNNYRSGNDTNLIAEEAEFNNTERYYFDLIHDKESLLTSYLEQFPKLTHEFKNDLAELGKNYQKLKVEFERTRSEEVLNALIMNLRLQQNLLNNQLKIIQLIEEKNENVSI